MDPWNRHAAPARVRTGLVAIKPVGAWAPGLGHASCLGDGRVIWCAHRRWRNKENRPGEVRCADAKLSPPRTHYSHSPHSWLGRGQHNESQAPKGLIAIGAPGAEHVLVRSQLLFENPGSLRKDCGLRIDSRTERRNGSSQLYFGKFLRHLCRTRFSLTCDKGHDLKHGRRAVELGAFDPENAAHAGHLLVSSSRACDVPRTQSKNKVRLSGGTADVRRCPTSFCATHPKVFLGDGSVT